MALFSGHLGRSEDQMMRAKHLKKVPPPSGNCAFDDARNVSQIEDGQWLVFIKPVFINFIPGDRAPTGSLVEHAGQLRGA
jgi:hypothetical protein